jgi:hypothetical protein
MVPILKNDDQNTCSYCVYLKKWISKGGGLRCRLPNKTINSDGIKDYPLVQSYKHTRELFEQKI